MIAKACRRVAGGSFSRLAAYVTDLKKAGELRDWRRTADYILDRKDGGQRVAAVRVTNCHNEEPGLALVEIAATQERNTRSQADKTYHLVVSFPPGERPNPEQLQDIEDRLCDAIGLGDHQRLSAVHDDKDHFHFHVAINKIHPCTLRAITPYFDESRLQAACVELEKKHGLTPTNHQMPDRSQGRRGGRAEAMEQHGKQQSLIQWVRDEAGPALLMAQETGEGWQELHKAAATYGLEVKPRGAGLVIAVAGETYARVKPSDIDRRLSFNSLTAKWGPYERPIGEQSAPERVYLRAPLHSRTPAAAALFRDYQREREHAVEARKGTQAARKAEIARRRQELAEWASKRREAIKAMPYTAEGRRDAFDALKRERVAAQAQDRARWAEQRRQETSHPLPTWQGWLENQAANGNTLAAQVLRSTDQRQAELGAAVLSAENAEQARHVVYQHLRPTVSREGAITYRVADGGRVIDEARQVRVDTVSVAASFLALSLAADRFGDRPLAVNGTDQFKAQVTQLAAVEGMQVTFADPKMEAERQCHVRELGERAAQASPGRAAGQASADEGLAAFIERRNEVRQRVSDVLPHRAWNEADAGEVTYRGRRTLPDGRNVLLLDRGGETLVKPASPAQAAKASTWQIGDSVRLDERGRLHEHRPLEQSPDHGR